MTTKRLLSIASRHRKIAPSPYFLPQLHSYSSTSAAVAIARVKTTIADLRETLISKLKHHKNGDATANRFLQHSSPDPIRLDHTRILPGPQTRVTTLRNGLRVATESDIAARSATVGVWIDAGSRFETEKTNGTAHFLEHMLFKGTKRRTRRQLEEEIENMGAHLNAYTSREQTTYYAKVMDRDVPKALDILSDILQNSEFDENNIRRERDVILREMEEVEGQTQEVLFDQLHAAAFCSSPLGKTILGPPRNVKTITRDDLQNYIMKHYTASRMVISASGSVKHDDIVQEAENLFTRFSLDSTTTSELIANEPAVFNASESRMLDNDMPLAEFVVAFKGASWTDTDSIALMVMQSMLGSWNKNVGNGKHMGSELARRIAVNDLAESIMSFNTNYKDTGLFGVYAIAKPDCLKDLSDAIMHELSRLSYEVSETDVTRSCNQLKSSMMLHLQGGTSAVAEDIGRQLLTYGRRIPFAELFARIDAVDAKTIKRVAQRFICDQELAISAMGPIEGLPDYDWFSSRTV